MEGLTKSYIKGNISERNEVLKSNPENIIDCLRHWANKHPNKDAIIFHSTTDPRFAITWQELYDRICQVARAYIAMGIKPGEVIAVCTRVCPEWLYAVFGAMVAGITVASIAFTSADGSDLVSLMERMKTCSLLLLDPGFKDSKWSVFKSLVEKLDSKGQVSSKKIPYLRHVVFTNSPAECSTVKTISDLLNDCIQIELPKIDPDAHAMLFQTSGSTGVPKLAAHTQTGILNFGRSFEMNAVKSGSAELNDMPFGWGGGFPFGLIFGQTRATISGICPPPEDKISFMVDIIQSEGCTNAFMPTQMISELTRRRADLSDNWPLKTIITGGQPNTKAIAVCLGKICHRLFVLYGSTEANGTSAFLVTDPDQFVDYTCGPPEHGVEVKILDEAGEIVPIGEKGEIYARPDWLFRGYFNDPEKTAQVKSADGWYKTNDYGRLNSEGHLYVEGRLSDLILSGGIKVSPSIYEAVLKSHPGVDYAIIVPVPDLEKYQVICACVVAKDGYDLVETELFEYMERKHNDEQKLFTVLPKFYLILSELPLETVGKVSRKTLKKMAAQQFSSK